MMNTVPITSLYSLWHLRLHGDVNIMAETYLVSSTVKTRLLWHWAVLDRIYHCLGGGCQLIGRTVWAEDRLEPGYWLQHCSNRGLTSWRCGKDDNWIERLSINCALEMDKCSSSEKQSLSIKICEWKACIFSNKIKLFPYIYWQCFTGFEYCCEIYENM